MPTQGSATPDEQLQQARKEAAYYRRLAEECGARRLKESEELSSLIEQLRQTEIVLMQARDDAEAANRAKTQFLATMSHELRTPLTAIIGYSQMMEQLVSVGDYRTVATDLHHIYNAGRHLLNLINDVLDLSRIEAGSLSISAERLDVPDMIEGIIATIRPLIEQNDNTLQLSCPEHMVVMYTDPLKVRQSLLNLLGNATKFTEAGTIRLSVTQDQIDGADWVSFAVADSGIGISADQMAKLFKSFSQVDDSLNRKYGGTGLGLALSQRLCQLLGGDITVESTFGEGSVFTMRLPAIAPATPALPAARPPATPDAADAAVEEELPIISENIVLLIDDNLDVSSLIAQLIGPERACIVHATSVAEGVDLAQAMLPDLIVIDVLMRDMGGWRALAELKANSEIAHIPAVMISIDGQRQHGLALGVAQTITRLLDAGDLAQSLRWLPAPTPTSSYILIIEEDSAISDRLLHALAREGWRAVVARTWCEALSTITARAPDMIVLNLLLPDIDGLQIISTLHERPGSIDCPIIIVTPEDLSNADRAQLQGSAHRILAKDEHRMDMLAHQLCRYLTAYGASAFKHKTEPPHA